MAPEHGYRPTSPTDPVYELMTWPVTTVAATDTLDVVVRALAADRIGAVLVLRHGTLVGVVSERDLGASGVAGRAAAEVMSAHLVTVPPQAPILEAARIMHDAHVRHLPVLADGLIVGIISMRDVFDVFLSHAERTSRLPPSP